MTDECHFKSLALCTSNDIRFLAVKTSLFPNFAPVTVSPPLAQLALTACQISDIAEELARQPGGAELADKLRLISVECLKIVIAMALAAR